MIAETNGGIDSITSAVVLTEPSRIEPGFSAANTPNVMPTLMPMTAAMPARRSELPIASLRFGHTGRFALDAVRPVPGQEPAEPREVAADVAAEALVQPVRLDVLLDVLLGRPRVRAQEAGDRIGADADGDVDEERDDEQRRHGPDEPADDEPEHVPSFPVRTGTGPAAWPAPCRDVTCSRR